MMMMLDPTRMLPGVQQVVDDVIHAAAMFHLRENDWARTTHGLGIARHHIQIGANGHRQVGFVDDQQVGLSDPGTAFAGDLVATRHINDVNRIVGQFPAEVGRQIVAAGFEQQDFRMEQAVQFLQREQVRRNVLADGGMGTSAGFHGADSRGVQGLVADEEFTVLAGEDVVGDGGDVPVFAKTPAELEHQRGLAAADGAAHANGEGPPLEITIQRQLALVEMTRMVEVLVGVAAGSVMMLVRAHAGGIGSDRPDNGKQSRKEWGIYDLRFTIYDALRYVPLPF